MISAFRLGARPLRHPEARSSWGRVPLGRSFVVALALWGAPAHAEDQDAINRTAARDLAQQAADAFDAADYATALDKFTRAQQLYPAPTLSFMQARCLHALGRWVEAFEMFNATARTELAPDAPEPFQRAVNDARLEAQLLEARLPRIEIRVPNHPGLNVSVDNVPLPTALHNVLHPMNPGEHRIQGLLGDRAYFDQTVTLTDRDRELVEIPDPPRPTASNQAVARSQERMDAPPSKPSKPTPAWVIPTAFTVGGVGTVGAIVSLILGSGVKAELDAVCGSDGACPPSRGDQVQSYKLYRVVFLTGVALGVTGIGTGVYFVLDDASEAEHVSLSVGPTGALLSGQF